MLLESVIFMLISVMVIIVGAFLSLREYKSDNEGGINDRAYVAKLIEEIKEEEIAKQKELAEEVKETYDYFKIRETETEKENHEKRAREKKGPDIAV